MASDAILIRALEKEMKAAEQSLRSAFWEVGRMVTFDGSRDTQEKGHRDPRSVVDEAVRKLRAAADYYDAVQQRLNTTLAEPSDV